MRMKLVAAAIEGILGVPRSAHAQTTNVVLYGRLNAITRRNCVTPTSSAEPALPRH